MTGRLKRTRFGIRAPFDVVVCASLVAGSGLAYPVVGLVWLASGGGALEVSGVAALACVLPIVAAIMLLAGLRPLRPVILAIVVLTALVHLVIAMSDGPAWTRALSGVLAAADIYALVLLNTRVVRAHFGLDT